MINKCQILSAILVVNAVLHLIVLIILRSIFLIAK